MSTPSNIQPGFVPTLTEVVSIPTLETRPEPPPNKSSTLHSQQQTHEPAPISAESPTATATATATSTATEPEYQSIPRSLLKPKATIPTQPKKTVTTAPVVAAAQSKHPSPAPTSHQVITTPTQSTPQSQPQLQSLREMADQFKEQLLIQVDQTIEARLGDIITKSLDNYSKNLLRQFKTLPTPITYENIEKAVLHVLAHHRPRPPK